MTPHYSDDWLTIYGGDCREVLATLPADSVDCVVTSPPYWGLRDYGTATWDGGDAECDHTSLRRPGPDDKSYTNGGTSRDKPTNTCRKCGAVRIDSQLGLERTPEEYVANMVAVFREVRRVLKPSGTCWLNLGDSYTRAQTGNVPQTKWKAVEFPEYSKAGSSDGAVGRAQRPGTRAGGLKDKDLVGIPWRVAFALQEDGWYLRSDIIWSKPNPMPESVTDRPTKSHEYLFLLTKSSRYFFDADAVRETLQGPPHAPGNKAADNWQEIRGASVSKGMSGHLAEPDRTWGSSAGRNIRSVWNIATRPYPGAHFAVFPPELPERCIKAGSSERGVCPECGAPWERVIERSGVLNLDRPQAKRAKELADAAGLTAEHIAAIRSVGVTDAGKARVTQDGTGKNTEQIQALADHAKSILGGYYREFLLDRGQTIGWKPTCDVTRFNVVVPDSPQVDMDAAITSVWPPISKPVPAVILDPFAGSGTVGMVANRLSRRAILIDLNPEYLKQQMNRNSQVPLGLTEGDAA